MKIGDVVEIICEGSNDPKSPHNLTGYSGVIIDINDDYEFPVLVNIEIEIEDLREENDDLNNTVTELEKKIDRLEDALAEANYALG